MEKGAKLYEASYLLSPVLSEEKISEEVLLVRKAIEDAGGSITIEEKPRNKRLAYAIKKPRVGNFESAYFGWMRFNLEPDSVQKVREQLKKSSDIIRSLVLLAIDEPVAPRIMRKFSREEVPAEKKASTVSTEEVDKKLEEMLGEQPVVAENTET